MEKTFKMYYRINDEILFRQYDEYGYINDNSEYGYHYLNDYRYYPGEKYISASGAVMLSKLSRTPKHIDKIVEELMDVFVDVDYEMLKQDTHELFDYLSDEGYLASGESYEACLGAKGKVIDNNNGKGSDQSLTAIQSDDCSKDLIDANDFLRSIHIEVASACNERCVHCYIPHGDKTSFIGTSLFYKIIQEGRELNIINVIMSGGEPLLHKDFLGFLRRCRELDLSVNVLSNLTLLTDEHLSEMKKNPLLSVQTSLYSMDPRVHDSITKLKGSFSKTMKSIQKLLSEGIPLQISCPIMKHNKDSFLEVIRWGKKHQIGVVFEPVIFASYDHSCGNLSNRLSLDEIENVVDGLLPEGYADMMRENARDKEALTEGHPICSVCRYNFCVSADGKVFPCAGWQSNIIGDLNNQTIKEIWGNSEKILALRNIKRKHFPKCVNCKDRGYCTVCMMSNSNESPEGNVFEINEFHCKVSATIHNKVEAYCKQH